MESIDYDRFARRARILRARAVADFTRGLAAALVHGVRSAGRVLAERLNGKPAPQPRCC